MAQKRHFRISPTVTSIWLKFGDKNRVGWGESLWKFQLATAIHLSTQHFSTFWQFASGRSWIVRQLWYHLKEKKILHLWWKFHENPLSGWLTAAFSIFEEWGIDKNCTYIHRFLEISPTDFWAADLCSVSGNPKPTQKFWADSVQQTFFSCVLHCLAS